MGGKTLFPAALFACAAVLLGAFGAHALQQHVTPRMLDIWRTAVNYQMWHALALGMIAMLPEQSGALTWSRRLMVAGILLFSGSLYGLVLTGIKPLGMVTPFGGMAFILAWALLAWHSWRKPQRHS